MPAFDIDAFKILHDCKACERHARTLLQPHLDEATLNAFFKKLQRIAPAILSDAAKRWLIISFVNCIMHYPPSTPPPYVQFIEEAIRFKKEVSAKLFEKLLSSPPPNPITLDEYIIIMQGLYSEKDVEDSGWLFESERFMWQAKDWKELLNCIQIQKRVTVNEHAPHYQSSLRSYAQFSACSSAVEYPLSEAEYEFIRRAYRNISREERASNEFFIKTEFELKHLYRIHQASDPNAPGYQAKMLAILRHIMRVITKKYPNSTQMLTVIAMISGQKGRLAQVQTGEGKTLIAMLCVAFLASQGNRVHWITSSADLALRDFEEAQPFFNALGIEIACISESEDSTKRYHQPVLMGTNTDFEFMLLNDLFKLKEDRQLPEKKEDEPWVAFIDEVDNLIIDLGAHSAIQSEEAPLQRSWLYPPILNFARYLKKEMPITQAQVTALRAILLSLQAGELKAAIELISDKQLMRLLKSAHQALHSYIRGKHYLVGNKTIQIVDEENTGRIQEEMRWGHGIHEFVEVKEGLPPQSESLTYAAVSHPSFFNFMYPHRLYGLTGTRGSKDEQDEIECIYEVNGFDMPPHTPCQRETLPAQLFKDEAAQWEAIALAVVDILAKNHPVLILVDSINTSKALHAFLEAKKISAQLLNGEQSAEGKKRIIAQAGGLKQVTVATNVASRGTDIQLMGQMNPGLYVIPACYPVNLRVERQIFGRAARKGEPGFCRMMLHIHDDFIKTLIPQEEERTALLSTPDFLRTLHPLREKHVKKLSAQRRYQAPRDQVLFKILLAFSERYCAHLAAFKTLNMETLLQAKPTLPTEPLPAHFVKLTKRALALYQEQEAGIKIDWQPFFKTFKEIYTLVLRQKWALFYTSLKEDYTPSLLGKLDTGLYELEIWAQYEQFEKMVLVPYIENLIQNAHTLFWQMISRPKVPQQLIFFQTPDSSAHAVERRRIFPY